MFTFIRAKKTLIKIAIVTTAVAAAQGLYVRSKYIQVIAPTAEISGRVKWIEDVKKEMRKKTEQNTLWKLISSKFSPTTNQDIHKQSSKTSHRRQIKLVLLGDSLVCGIGCEKELVLPKVLAKGLSLALKADVSWSARGINGGTANAIREHLPKIASDLRPTNDKEEIFVIVVCGLNDWKQLLINFPFGDGPTNFKNNLDNLLQEIKTVSGGCARVFLPALPIVCAEQDSKAHLFQVRPLKYFVEFVSRKWDQQKQILAENMGTNTLKLGKYQVTFIGEPDVTAPYATPGEGNICDDGVHPSSQGYKWWALHLCDSILHSLQLEEISTK